MEMCRAGYVREARVPPESHGCGAPNPSPGRPLSAGATEARIEPWPQIDFPKVGILEGDKSKPIPNLVQDVNDENFTKKGVREKSGVVTVKVASGLHIFLLKSHEGPSWA